MQVETHIAGSHCVVWLHLSKEHYIDARRAKDGQGTHIEVVRNGQVTRRRSIAHSDRAPEMILMIAKEELCQ